MYLVFFSISFPGFKNVFPIVVLGKGVLEFVAFKYNLACKPCNNVYIDSPKIALTSTNMTKKQKRFNKPYQ